MPSPFTISPLFRTASAAILREAREEFSRTALGRIVNETERVLRNPGRGGAALQRFSRAMKSFRSTGVNSALGQLSGTTLGQLARGVQRYSRGGGASAGLVQDFLRQLGPAGELLDALMGPGASGRLQRGTAASGDVNTLVRLVEAMTGGFVVRPGAGRAGGAAGGKIDKSTLAKMAEALTLHGYTVIPPGGQFGGGGGGRSGRGTGGGGAGGRSGGPPSEPGGRYPRESIREIPRRANLPPGLDKNHPAVTGEMVSTPNSSNVHSVGWDSDRSFLYVRFLAGRTQLKMQGRAGMRGMSGRAGRGGNTPGPLYRYEEVSYREFQSLLDVAKGGPMGGGPGDWVWDHLRVRGSHAAHQKQYALVGIEGGYVPRRATTDIDESGDVFEVFKPRTVEDLEGNVFESVFGEEPAPGFGHEVGWGVNRGDRGTPDRGQRGFFE